MQRLFFIMSLTFLFSSAPEAAYEFPLLLGVGSGGLKSYQITTSAGLRNFREWPLPWTDLNFNAHLNLKYRAHYYDKGQDTREGLYNQIMLNFRFGSIYIIRDLASVGLAGGLCYSRFHDFKTFLPLMGFSFNADYSFLWEKDLLLMEGFIMFAQDYMLCEVILSGYVYRNFRIYSAFSYDGEFDHYSHKGYNNAMLWAFGVEYSTINER
ncbi:hypothetical protein JW877_10055 [bacterium]|nr:hypothetical protein [bacterium]